MIKRFNLLFVVSIIIVSVFTQVVVAQDNLSRKLIDNKFENEDSINSSIENRIRLQAPDYYTEEYQKFIRDNIRNNDNLMDKNIVPMAGKLKKLVVPLKIQECDYYCGPASLQMILLYKGKSYSQKMLADYSSTSKKEGTYVYRMKDTLNRILGNRYVYVNLRDQNLLNGLMYSIDRDYPVICNIKTGVLKNYEGMNGRPSPHYLVATGYAAGFSGNMSASDVYYNDPHYNRKHYGAHKDTIEKMERSINNNAGFFIRSK